jgi:hypothetical protein
MVLTIGALIQLKEGTSDPKHRQQLAVLKETLRSGQASDGNSFRSKRVFHRELGGMHGAVSSEPSIAAGQRASVDTVGVSREYRQVSFGVRRRSKRNRNTPLEQPSTVIDADGL